MSLVTLSRPPANECLFVDTSISNDSVFWQIIDDLAIKSLYDEISLELKPGLVCPSSNGSHQDMDYDIFMMSINALMGYFGKIACYGYDRRSFDDIRRLGVNQEQKMLQVTDGINTHKGAIFNLGFIAAAIGRCIADNIALTADNICQTMMYTWQHDLLNNLPRNPNSHGQKVYQKYGMTGAIELVADGFRIIRELALPCYYETLQKTGDVNKSKSQTLMTLIAHLDDTNMVWRGGMNGLRFGQNLAKSFLAKGGVFHLNWQEELLEINRQFVKRNLSAGGSADLLAVTLFFVGTNDEFGDTI